MIYLNTITYKYDFQGNPTTKNIKNSINNIENNLIKMNKLKNSNLSDEELSSIKKEITKNLEIAKNLPFLNNNYHKTIINQREFYEIIDSSRDFQVSGIVASYKTIAKYNNKLDNDDFIQITLMQMLYPSLISKDIIENYKYPTSIDYNTTTYGVEPMALINSIAIRMNTVEYLSNLVLESSDLNE